MGIYDSSDPESYAQHRADTPPAGLGGPLQPHTAPTTDAAGRLTGKPQNKIVAVLTSGVGATIVAAVVSQFVGIDLDPVTSTALAGGIVTLIGTLAGYLRPNSTDAN
jgi:hypothetical protein